MGQRIAPWQRPGLETTAGDHERRIGALERRSGVSGAVYFDERVLDADTVFVLFDSFPADLHLLELSWAVAVAGGDGNDAALYLDFEGDTLASTAEDYRWNLVVGNQQGSQGSATDASAGMFREGGAIGYVAASKPGYGRVTFPGYQTNFPPVGSGPLWVGTGGWVDVGPGDVDSWTVAGQRDNGAALTSIRVQVAFVNVVLSTPDMAAGSRLTLTGY